MSTVTLFPAVGAKLPGADNSRNLGLIASSPASSQSTAPAVGRSSATAAQTATIPSTLARTKNGLAVRVNELTVEQKAAYDRLSQSGLSASNINEIINILSTRDVGGLANKYSWLSADNLACIGLLANGLNGKTSVHDVTHVLLSDPKNIAYGVSEREEATGHALVQTFINSPKGIYDGFSVSVGPDGKPVVSSTPLAKKNALEVFNRPQASSTLINQQFAGAFRENSYNRVFNALDQASSLAVQGAGTSESRFDGFYRALSKSGQLPKKYDPVLAEKLRANFLEFDLQVRSSTSDQARQDAKVIATINIVQDLTASATAEFKKIPADKKLQMFADGIATVLALDQASPNQFEKPTSDSRGDPRYRMDRFSQQTTMLDTKSYDPATGKQLLAQPGFLKNYLQIRNQVRQVLGIPTAPVKIPQGKAEPTGVSAQQPQVKPAPAPNSGAPAATGTTPGTTTPNMPNAPNKTKPGNSKGGYVQRPDPLPGPKKEDLKPLTQPLPTPQKAGTVHPPSKNLKPDAKDQVLKNPLPTAQGKDAGLLPGAKREELDPRKFIFTFPFPVGEDGAGKTAQIKALAQWGQDLEQGKTTRGALTLKHMIGTSDGLRQVLQRGYGGTVVQALSASRTTGLLQRYNSAALVAKIADASQSSDPALKRAADALGARFQQVAGASKPLNTEFTWSPSRVSTAVTRAPVTNTRVPQQSLKSSQTRLEGLQQEFIKLQRNAAPTLAEAQKLMARTKSEMTAVVARVEEFVKSLPSHLQALMTTQLAQLQGAWDRWSPGALRNLESFGNGAAQMLGQLATFLAGLGQIVDTMQKVGG